MIDIEQPAELIAYLQARGHGVPASIEVLAGGVSNRTVFVQWQNGEAWVVKQALAKLRVKADWFSDPARIHREALGLQWMGKLLPGAAPALVFEDEVKHILAMQAVPQPHDNWKVMLLCGDLRDDHVLQFAAVLAGFQRNALTQCDEIAATFDDRAFFETLRLEPYFACTAERVPQAGAFMHALIERTRANRHTLVHGDYSPKNVLVHEGKLVLLDYEVIHWGDPAFDAGFSMTHLLSKAHHLSTSSRQAAAHSAAFTQAAHLYWQAYTTQVTGLFGDLETRSVHCTLGCLLARVDGRSPLEYLSEAERHRQRNAVLSLMAAPPATMLHLIDQFAVAVEA